MSISLNEQLEIFLMMLAYGAFASLIFDVLRSVYRTFKPSVLTVGIVDLLFWILISIFTFYAFFIISDGQIRFFSLLGMVLGSIFYFLLLSKVVLYLFLHILSIFQKIFLLIFKMLLTILNFLYKMVYGISLFFLKPVFWIVKTVKRRVVFSFVRFRMGFVSFFKNKRKAAKIERRAKIEKKYEKCKKRKKIKKKSE